MLLRHSAKKRRLVSEMIYYATRSIRELRSSMHSSLLFAWRTMRDDVLSVDYQYLVLSLKALCQCWQKCVFLQWWQTLAMDQDDFNTTENTTSPFPTMTRGNQLVVDICRIIFPTIYGIVFIVGLIGNATLIYMILANKPMRTKSNVLIVSLAAGDFLLILVSVPFAALLYATDLWLSGEAMCKVSKCFCSNYVVTRPQYCSASSKDITSFLSHTQRLLSTFAVFRSYRRAATSKSLGVHLSLFLFPPLVCFYRFWPVPWIQLEGLWELRARSVGRYGGYGPPGVYGRIRVRDPDHHTVLERPCPSDAGRGRPCFRMAGRPTLAAIEKSDGVYLRTARSVSVFQSACTECNQCFRNMI